MLATLSVRRRPIALLLAFLLAGAATAALASYVWSLENGVEGGKTAVQVYVAKDTIPAFMSVSAALSRGLVEQVPVPQSLAAAGAIVSLEAVRDSVATVDILKGEQLQAARFVSAEEAASLLPIPRGKQAFTVALDASPAVGGFVRPGDHVSVIAKADVPGKDNATRSKVGFLVQNVSVLAVGDRVATPGRETRTTGVTEERSRVTQTLLTLAVSPSDAERLAFAALEGELWFTLLSKTDPAVGRTSGRTADTLFPGR